MSTVSTNFHFLTLAEITGRLKEAVFVSFYALRKIFTYASTRIMIRDSSERESLLPGLEIQGTDDGRSLLQF